MEKSKEKIMDKSPQNHDIQDIESGMKNLTCAPITMENKIKNIMELPDEILLKIMEYLSTSDILRNIAPVSKRFYRLTPDLIKQAEFKSIGYTSFWQKMWSEERKKKYFNDFFEVLKNAQKLKYLSLHLDYSSAKNFYENWIQPSVNRQCLEEVCIQFGNVRYLGNGVFSYGVFSSSEQRPPWYNFLDQCPKLKILKIQSYLSQPMNLLSVLTAISSFNSNCLQELHLNFYNFAPKGASFLFDDSDRSLKKVLKRMTTENLPNMEYLCLTLDFEICPIYREICREIASEQKIKIEIRNTRDDLRYVYEHREGVTNFWLVGVLSYFSKIPS